MLLPKSFLESPNPPEASEQLHQKWKVYQHRYFICTYFIILSDQIHNLNIYIILRDILGDVIIQIGHYNKPSK